MARRFLMAVLLAMLGGAVGCGLGLASGLTWIEVMQTSCFEGYCGYVAVFHALIGLFLGAVAGMVAAGRLARRMG